MKMRTKRIIKSGTRKKSKSLFSTVLKTALVFPLLLTLGSCQSTVNDQLSLPKKGEEIAIVKTNYGSFKLKFFPKYAPLAVENFITHAKNGYYNGIIFHRVVKGFVIQGGDPEGTGMGGNSIWSKPFKDEVTPNLHHFRGAVSMANAGPDTNGSQFFVVQSTIVQQTLNKSGVLVDNNNKAYPKDVSDKYLEIGGATHLDMGYSLFGQVFEGMDVVDTINSLKVNSKQKPLEDAVIESVKITVYDEK